MSFASTDQSELAGVTPQCCSCENNIPIISEVKQKTQDTKFVGAPCNRNREPLVSSILSYSISIILTSALVGNGEHKFVVSIVWDEKFSQV